MTYFKIFRNDSLIFLFCLGIFYTKVFFFKMEDKPLLDDKMTIGSKSILLLDGKF